MDTNTRRAGIAAAMMIAIITPTTACGTDAAPPAQNIRIEPPAATTGPDTDQRPADTYGHPTNPDARDQGMHKAPPDAGH